MSLPVIRFVRASVMMALAILLVATSARAQVSAGGTPPSFRHDLLLAVPTVDLPAPDVGRFLAEDADDEKAGIPLRFGAPIPVDLGLEGSGVWSTLPDGGRVWRLRIASPGAYSLNLLYDVFDLPAGAEFFLYNDDQSQLLGAFTEYNSASSPDGGFATQPLAGDAVVLEYHEPEWVSRPGRIHVSSVVHAYRNLFGRAEFDRNYGDSGSCNNNVNCPEGSGWQAEKRAVAMILTSGGSRICTGALVNNTAQDLRQYFLTANHCGLSTGSYIFMFNYESPGCTNVNGPTNQTVQGCTLRANNTASDFTLVELTENIPSSYNVHFAGWNNVNTPATSSTCIHHPSGDIKKISFSNTPTTDDTWSGTPAASHWRANWSDGVTEPGSSGSPLFDQNHRIIGQLHGGPSSCSTPTYDQYGKFSLSWSYGGSPTNQLRNWLDPGNTGATVLNGVDDAPPTVPVLALAGVSVVDGNDGALDPGESPTFVITLSNSGASASSIAGTLTETSPYVTVTDGTGGWPTIAQGGSAASSNSFVVSVDPSTPVGHSVTFTLAVTAAGGYSNSFQFTLVSGLTLDGFETGDFSAFPWATSGNLPWTVSTGTVHGGAYVARSGAIGNNQSSTLSLPLQVAAASDLSFWYKVSSEANYDYLRFYVDGVQQGEWSGEVDWTLFTTTLAAGAHTCTWTYSKDGSLVNGSDAAWVDDVVMPITGAPQYPDIAVTPASLSRVLAPEGSSLENLAIANTGQAALTWTATASTASLQTSVPTAKLAKGEVDTRPGSFERAAGGPDAFGYRWKDSNEPGGPAYSWVDISATGTTVAWASGTADDGLSAALPLGFSFPFYGTDQTTVKVCSNGWLSFNTTSTTYTNQGIPNNAAPNSLVAPFWDDLDARTTGTIKYRAEASRFIVQWTGVPLYNSSNLQTFQVILHADGRILYQYQTVTAATSCTVGLENATGTDGLQVVFNASYLVNGLAIEFGTSTPWLTLAATSGSVPAGGSDNLGVNLSAAGLSAGTYTGQVAIASNDPDEATVVVPVTLIVGSVDTTAPAISVDCLGDTWSDQPRAVAATISDASGVASASLLVSVDGGATQSYALSAAGGDQWTGLLPGLPAPAGVVWQVQAVDASPAGNSGSSAFCSYQVLPLGVPVAQVALDGAGGALVSWTAVPGATAYMVYVAPAPDGPWSPAGSTAGTSLLLPVGDNETRVVRVTAIH